MSGLGADAETGNRQSSRQLSGQRLGHVLRTENTDISDGAIPRIRELPQGDPNLPRYAVGMQHRLARRVFGDALEGPQGDETASSAQLERHWPGSGTEVQRQHPLRGRVFGRLQLAQGHRDTHQLEPRTTGPPFQRGQARLSQCGQGHPLATLTADTPRVGHLKGRSIAVKTLLGLQLQQAQDIGIGHHRDLCLGDQQARNRQSHRTGAFPNAGLIQLSPELLADRFRITRINVQRQFGLKSERLLKPALGPAQEAALDATALPRKPQYGGRSFTRTGTQFQKIHHGVVWAFI